MIFTFPIYIKVIKGGPDKKPFYRAQPLFFIDAAQSIINNEDLQRAMVKLRQRLKKTTDRFGSDISHKTLASLVFNPPLKTCTRKLTLKIDGDFVTEKFFFVTLRLNDQDYAFCPDVAPPSWFEFNDSTLDIRAEEFLTKHFNYQVKQRNLKARVVVAEAIVNSQRWITTLDLDVRVDQISAKEADKKMMALWTNEELNGAVELAETGRCLDHLYPDELDLAVGREADTNQLFELLQSHDRRPTMIVGEHLTGKTSLVHSVVRRRIDQRVEQGNKTVSSRKNVWLLSPQRLISGMCYVGQWENRVLAILREAAERDHVLYFDDLPGLFRAGQSRDSKLAVADLLKSALQDRSVRILGEITPAAFDVLSELDRSFVEQFHINRIEPTSIEDTYSIAINVARKFEFENNCTFAVDGISKAIELQRQYVRQVSFPGKAVQFLKRLAVKFDDYIAAQDIVTEFCESKGVSADIVDDQRFIDRQQIRAFFQKGLIGQTAAIEACADVVMTAKAKLNAPGKPLATMLFPGPTGVGKTECVKQLARFLFRSEENLLRFDLNEFKTAYSAARLVGTVDQPEGLLTSAVRRQPFCVILLDEIEKAHADVFDILLQVTGEGRLTDAIGRTTDFTNAIIVMTSNLGTKRTGQTVGFVDSSNEHDYVTAAEKFFKPELFNRIDRVVPFHPLNESQIGKIADLMMNEVISREGIVRRRCILQVDSGLIARLVTKGYHPDLGARAMKRAIETEFTQPISIQLAAIRSDVPTVIEVKTRPPSEVASTPQGQIQPDDQASSTMDVLVHELHNVKPVLRPTVTPDDDSLVDAAKNCLKRLRADHFDSRPEGEISTSNMSPELLRYFGLREQADSILDQIRSIEDAIDARKNAIDRPAIATSQRSRGDEYGEKSRRVLVELNTVNDIHQFVEETVSKMNDSTSIAPMALRLINQCAMLEAMCKSKADEAIFFVQSHAPADKVWADSGLSLEQYVRTFFRSLTFVELGFDVIKNHTIGRRTATTLMLHLKGDGIDSLLTPEVGTQLACDSAGRLTLIKSGFITKDHSRFERVSTYLGSVNAPKTNSPTRPKDQTDTETKNSTSDVLACLADYFENEPHAWRVLRMFEHKGSVIDFRTDTVAQDAPMPPGEALNTGSPKHAEPKVTLGKMIGSALPLSEEFEVFCSEPQS